MLLYIQVNRVISMYTDFDYADKLMALKNFSSVEEVNINDYNGWAYTKSEVLVFSKPQMGNRQTGSFQFELKSSSLAGFSPGTYENYFFSENLLKTARSTYCFFSKSDYFPLKEDSNLSNLSTISFSNEISIYNSSFRFNGTRPYLSSFVSFEKSIFINFITKFKIKLYKHDTTGEYVFFWLLNNNIIINEAREKLLLKYEEYKLSGTRQINTDEIFNSLIEIQKKIDLSNIPHNMIVFGSPGTGKSYYLDKVTKCIPNTFTVTFHPEYDYIDFIGQYKPKSIICDATPNSNDECKSKIVYKFIPGIFINALKKALCNPDETVVLKIEEINRGNTASIFGDIFQLLDRDTDGNSKYAITPSEEIKDYLKLEEIFIPKNLFIFATMNTSDQSLYPMDSAFKRRWTWKYIPIDLDDARSLKIVIDDIEVNWADFIEKINDKILIITDSEDKQLGNRFVNPKNDIIDIDTFVGKVLFYLWTDIFKHEDHFDDSNIFKSLKNDKESTTEKISFSSLYNIDGSVNIPKLKTFIESLNLE